MSYVPFRKKHLAVLTASILDISVLAGCQEGDDGLAGADGIDGVDGVAGADGVDGTEGITNFVVNGLKRLATAPLGAEFTGMFLNDDGTFFLNVQHPSTSNSTADANGYVYDKGTIGAIVGQDFTNLPATDAFAALDLPLVMVDKETVQTAEAGSGGLGPVRVRARERAWRLHEQGH